MKQYGLIGKTLGHSFSERYFTSMFEDKHIDAVYRLYPIETLSVTIAKQLMDDLDGFNVTIPYKESIIPMLDTIDETARVIGAVNVVKGHRGYNTDWIGFVRSIQPMLTPKDKHALILGTGGAAKAVAYGLHQLGITTQTVSRDPAKGMTYTDINSDVLSHHSIIINATPIGMVPKTDEVLPIASESITSAHLLYDCIYNPEETRFLAEGRKRGARVQNGLPMLYGQADETWKIWEGNL